MKTLELNELDAKRLKSILEPIVIEEARNRAARIVYSEEIFWADVIMLQLGWDDEFSKEVQRAADEGMEIFRERDPVAYEAVAIWLSSELHKEAEG